MAVDPQIPSLTDALFNAYTGQTVNDPKTYTSHNASKITGRYILKPIQDEVLKLISVALSGGGALTVRNNTGSTLAAGPVRVTGYDTTNSAFTIGLADADTNTQAHFILLSSLATATSGVAYLSGDYTSALDTSGAALGDPVYLSASGVATLTAPTGADQIVQIIGYVKTLSATGTIRGYVHSPIKIGTSNLQDSAVTTAKITDANVTAGKLASDSVTTAKILDSNVTLAKLADVATATVLGRSAGGTGAVSALTALPAMDGSALTGIVATVADGSITGGPAGAGVKIAASTITHDNVAAANKDGVAGTASMRTLGTGAQTACAGNDARLSDTRTPTDGSVTTAKIVDANVTLAKLANIADATILGNNTGGGAAPLALTATQTKTLLAIAAGDVSGLAASATTDTTNAANITSGTLPAARIGAASIDLTTKVMGDLPLANLAQGTARSVLGVTGNSTADYAPIQGTADQVLRVNMAGTALEFGTMSTRNLVDTLHPNQFPALIGFRATRSANQTLSATPGTWTKINFDVDNNTGVNSFDTNSAFDNATNYRFTAPKSGYYQINACITFSPSVADSVYGVRIVKNGTAVTTLFPSQPYDTTNNGFSGVFSDIIYLASGDYIHVDGFADYASPVVYYAQQATYFSGAFIGG